MLKENDKQKVENALLKKALGYNFEEVQEEFSLDEDGELKKNKVKVSKKHSPPDMSAVKTLLGICGEQNSKYDQMTEEELLQAREELLQQLKQTQKMSNEE